MNKLLTYVLYGDVCNTKKNKGETLQLIMCEQHRTKVSTVLIMQLWGEA
jgi:hypothetical protein